MNKQLDHLPPLVSSSNGIIFPAKRRSKRKQAKTAAPPSEETVIRLNALVKQAPFCFHFYEKENDTL